MLPTQTTAVGIKSSKDVLFLMCFCVLIRLANGIAWNKALDIAVEELFHMVAMSVENPQYLMV